MSTKEKIAIIGVGCKFPGANNLDEFWKVLKDGENHVTDIPASRWNHDVFYHPDSHEPAKTHARKAGLLQDHLAFDNTLFKINDLEADNMDPQQRYVLECVHMALEDAGLTRHQIKGSDTSVYVGAMNTDYRGQFLAASALSDSYTVTGVSSSIIAARVSYVLDLQGAAMTVDTACSSALTAVDLAVQALKAGRCSMAICGGVNSILTPDVFVHVSKAGMVSAKGQCFAFSDQVDGYTRGEGCGILILKRLSDATEARNKIWATIETGCNQDGGAIAPISRPSEEQQIKLLELMYMNPEVNPKDIEYIEAHGTGTPVGDVVEVNALGKFFKQKHSERIRYIGSVKTNIGHLESAAGVAGLIKVLLMMKHSTIVPSLHFHSPNPNIDFTGFKFLVPKEIVTWVTKHKMACLNSFGFGGTNCHAVIQSHQQQTDEKTDERENDEEFVVCFSGLSSESLIGSMKDLLHFPELKSMKIEDVAFTSTIHRDHYPLRLGFVAKSMQDLQDQVTQKLHTMKQPSSQKKEPYNVFVFCGMGTAWLGMGRELIQRSHVFRNKIREIDTLLLKYVRWTVESRLTTEKNTSDLVFWPIAIFSFQIALASLWMSVGVIPDCVVGYSVGEVAAAHVAGFVSLQNAVKIMYHRTRLLAQLVGAGRMIVVTNIDKKKLEEMLNKLSGKANIAAEISPRAFAVSGENSAVEVIATELREAEEPGERKPVIHDVKLVLAYHSHCVETCARDLAQELKNTNWQLRQDGHIMMMSTVTGEKVQGLLTADHWMKNVREPVRFLDAAKNSYKKDRNNVYFEIGPKPFMQAHAKHIFPEESVNVVVSMRNKGTWETFLEALARAYEQRCSLKWRKLPCSGHTITPVPRYKFTPRNSLQQSEMAIIIQAGLSFINKEHGFVLKVENTDQYKIFLSVPTFKSVYDHRVSGRLFVPGALYGETGLSLSKFISRSKVPKHSISATFEQPCTFKDRQPVLLDLDVSKTATIDSNNQLVSYKIAVRQKEQLFATIYLHPQDTSNCGRVVNIDKVESRCDEVVTSEEIYRSLAGLGFTYGPSYKLLKKARRNNKECLAALTVPRDLFQEISLTSLHPSVLDAMIQTYVVITKDENKEVFPISLGRLTLFKAVEEEMFIHTTLTTSDDDLAIFDSKLITGDGEIVADLEDLKLKFLLPETEFEDQGNKTKNLSTSSWVPVKTWSPSNGLLNSKALYITGQGTSPKAARIEYDIDVDCSDRVKAQLENMNVNQNFNYIILDTNLKTGEAEDAADIQSKIMNLFMVLKSVFTHPLKVPVYVFTRWAIPGNNSTLDEDRVSPALTSIWGLTRSAVQEKCGDITIIDLHLPHSQSTLECVTSIADYLYQNEELKCYSEWMVTSQSFFINQAVVPLSKHTSVPSYKDISADSKSSLIQICQGMPGSSHAFNVYFNVRPRASHLEISVSRTFIPHPQLFSLSIPYHTFDAESAHLGCGLVTFSLETVGVVRAENDRSDQTEVVTCYPCPIGSIISVPPGVVIPKMLFTYYRPGTLIKLVTLWSLSCRIPGTHITILTSSSTSSLAGVLRGMVLAQENHAETCSVVMVGEVQGGQDLNSTVISLVLLDEDVLSVLAQHWPQAEYLVTLQSLQNRSLKSYINYLLPQVKVITLDTSDFFQPDNLLEVVPKVKEWMTDKETVCQDNILNNLRCGRSSVSDLVELLKVQEVNFDKSRVRVDKTALFKKDAVYAVVGGLTGLGWVLVRFLSRKGAGNIAVLNRRTPSKEREQEIINVCTTTHCKIKCFSCDVCDWESLKNFSDNLANEFPGIPLKGVFFGAAVLADESLSNVTREMLEKVMSPKVLGAWNTHKMTRHRNLDYFVLHSSVASVVGNFGQAAYSAANAFLDGLASYRKQMNLPGKSINWGPLNVGMLEGKERTKQILEQRGMLLLTEKEIEDILTPVLLLDLDQVTACKFDLNIWKNNVISGSSAQEKEISNELMHQVQEALILQPEERLEIYQRFLMILISKVIGLGENVIRRESDLRDLGMDSLLATRVREEIYKVTGCRLQIVDLVSGEVSVKSLAEKLDEQLQRENVQSQHD